MGEFLVKYANEMSIFVRYVTRTPQNKSCCFSPNVYSFFKCIIKKETFQNNWICGGWRNCLSPCPGVLEKLTVTCFSWNSSWLVWIRNVHYCAPKRHLLSQMKPVYSHALFLVISSHLWINLHNGLFCSGFMIRIFHLACGEWLLFGVERDGISHTCMCSGAPKNSWNC